MSAKPSRSNSASAARSEASKGASMVKPASASLTPTDILSVIESLKKKVEANRLTDVKSRIEENKQKLMNVTVSKESNNTLLNKTGRNSDLLMKRQSDAVEMQKGIDIDNMDKDSSDSQDDGVAPSAVLLGASIPVKSGVRPIRLPEVKTLPSYTTWIFLNRNQRMTEDQSVVGRRRIYYDPNGGEALICSDSEEEVIEEEEEKKEFAESEDYILRMTIQELGSSDTVLDVLGQCFSRKPCDVKARYEVLCKAEFDAKALTYGNNEASSQSPNPYIDKDLEAALDSFDNLFCRRCYVFDCRLHGCSQDLVFPAEKPHPWNHSDEKPCGPHCYRSPMKSESYITASSQGCDNSKEKPDPSCDVGPTRRKKSFGSSVRWKEKSNPTESASSNVRNASESSDSDVRSRDDDNSVDQSSSRSKPAGKPGNRKKKNKRLPEKIIISKQKRQKKMVTSDPKSVSREMRLRSHSRKDDEDASSSLKKVNSTNEERSKKKESPVLRSSKSLSDEVIDNPPEKAANVRKELVDESRVKQEANDDKSWKALEKGLFEKGLEIFGRNSCLISRNLLNGLKTCREVYQYMTGSENKLFSQGGDSATKADCDEMGNDMRGRSRYVRRRGRVRRLKYTWKSTAYHSIRKRISERKDLPCRQYNPCGCQTACGKQCPCILNGSCCEKYCGCPKTCKNRFRGCHCAKSQCRSRQCPCFAADRECDPDVCRNCWVSCGDGTLGVPSQRGDNYECRNMKLLLKQQQRVLLGRSDVSGWGAFLKNSVGKHEYLGEYTGELISHREADKRGKIYDRENSSFLFNLNDQFVLDAYRKGDKLKFANHSPDPNCYAKVIMVAGDHRVGIFAKERMNSGEELFYDYRYEPDRAPAWARRPEASGSKKDDAGPSTGRAKKLA